MYETKITKMTQTTRYGADMTSKDVYVISFMVGDSGPFTVETPVEGFDQTKARMLVDEKARAIAGLLAS